MSEQAVEHHWAMSDEFRDGIRVWVCIHCDSEALGIVLMDPSAHYASTPRCKSGIQDHREVGVSEPTK